MLRRLSVRERPSTTKYKLPVPLCTSAYLYTSQDTSMSSSPSKVVLCCSVSWSLDWAAASSEIAARHGRSLRSASQHFPRRLELRDWPTKGCRRRLARAAGTTEGQRSLPWQPCLWLAEGSAAPRVSAIAQRMALTDQLKAGLPMASQIWAGGWLGIEVPWRRLQRCSVAQSLYAALPWRPPRCAAVGRGTV
jgi:hypothetical protein